MTDDTKHWTSVSTFLAAGEDRDYFWRAKTEGQVPVGGFYDSRTHIFHFATGTGLDTFPGTNSLFAIEVQYIVAKTPAPVEHVSWLIVEAQERGIEHAVNDLANMAALSRQRLIDDGVALTSRQTWASIEVVIAFVRGLRDQSHKA